MPKQILNSNECFSLSCLSVKGDDLVRLGIAEGKELGRILQTRCFLML